MERDEPQDWGDQYEPPYPYPEPEAESSTGEWLSGDTVRILPDNNVQPQQPDRRLASTSGRRETFEPYKGYNPDPLPPSTRSPRPATSQLAADNRAVSYPPVVQPAAQAPVVVQSRRGPTACAILAGTFGLLAIACALLAFATLKGGMDGLGRLGGIFPNFSLGTTPTVTIDTSRPAVVDQVRALSRLEAVNYQVDKVVSGKSSGPLPDFLTSDKILLVAHGEVVAGYDLSGMGPDSIETISNTVVITLPAPIILYHKLDNDRTYVYDRQTGIMNKPDPNLETQMRQVAEQQIVIAANEDGILDRARTNGQQVLKSLIMGLGYSDVQFRELPATPPTVATPIPQVP